MDDRRNITNNGYQWAKNLNAELEKLLSERCQEMEEMGQM